MLRFLKIARAGIGGALRLDTGQCRANAVTGRPIPRWRWVMDGTVAFISQPVNILLALINIV
jgi:hypothetical protein